MKIMVRKRRKTESFYADSEKEATLKVEEIQRKRFNRRIHSFKN